MQIEQFYGKTINLIRLKHCLNALDPAGPFYNLCTNITFLISLWDVAKMLLPADLCCQGQKGPFQCLCCTRNAVSIQTLQHVLLFPIFFILLFFWLLVCSRKNLYQTWCTKHSSACFYFIQRSIYTFCHFFQILCLFLTLFPHTCLPSVRLKPELLSGRVRQLIKLVFQLRLLLRI